MNLAAILDKHRDIIRTAHCVKRERPDFDRDPMLTAIPRHEAMFFVLGQMKQQLHGALPRHGPCGNGAVSGFMELNELFQNVSCYRLTPGRLESMADLALHTLKGKGSQHG